MLSSDIKITEVTTATIFFPCKFWGFFDCWAEKKTTIEIDSEDTNVGIAHAVDDGGSY